MEFRQGGRRNKVGPLGLGLRMHTELMATFTWTRSAHCYFGGAASTRTLILFSTN
jgi:hypothetical protein